MLMPPAADDARRTQHGTPMPPRRHTPLII